MGCDISKQSYGIVDAGRGAFVSVLRSFNRKDVLDLNPRSFATKLRRFMKPQCCFTYSVDGIAQDLDSFAQ